MWPNHRVPNRTPQDRKRTYLNKHRVPSTGYEIPLAKKETLNKLVNAAGYEIPYGEGSEQALQQNHRVPNEGYEIPQDEGSAKALRQNHRIPNEDYEIPQDEGSGQALRQNHRVPGTSYKIPLQDIKKTKSKKPKLPKVDYNQTDADQNGYETMQSTHNLISHNSALYDSDGYVSIC